MTFQELNEKIKTKFNDMQKDLMYVTGTAVDDESVAKFGDKMWETYYHSFENDPIFRHPESSLHNCTLDKKFIRRYGNIVAIDDNYQLVSMFDVDIPESSKYYLPMKNLAAFVKSAKIINVFQESEEFLKKLPVKKQGNSYKMNVDQSVVTYTEDKTFGRVKALEPYVFYHFCTELNKEYLKRNTPDAVNAQLIIKSAKVPLSIFDEVEEYSASRALLHVASKQYSFDSIKKIVMSADHNNLELWAWKNIDKYDGTHINSLAGVLLEELQEDPVKACENWNRRIDPINYMKATTPVTSKQREDAIKRIDELGYTEPFDRRVAVESDFTDFRYKNTVGTMKGFFDAVPVTTATVKPVGKEVTIEEFMELLKGASNLEIFVEAKHQDNFVVLTTAKNKECKLPFKWDNPFSYTYKNNLSGVSHISRAVTTLGGKIDAPLRCSLLWQKSTSDLDLWCIRNAPFHNIGYNTGFRKDKGGMSPDGGQLDVDVVNPPVVNGIREGAENIYYNDVSKLHGTYTFLVAIYSDRRDICGFEAELVVNNKTYYFNVPRAGMHKKTELATVEYDHGKFVKVTFHVTPIERVINTWGIQSNNFHTVTIVCNSPNCWDTDKPLGSKHYMFMLKDCKPDGKIRSFHVDHLNRELYDNRKFLDLASSHLMVEAKDNSLAGLGFEEGIDQEFTAKVTHGTSHKVYTVKF